MKTSMMRNIIFLILTAIFVYGCKQTAVYEKNKEIENKKWLIENEVNFNVAITDTVALYDFYISLRNNHEYPYRNIYIFLKTIFPNGMLIQDTLNVILADVEGKWLGSGMGDIKYNQVLVKRGIRFPLKGTYAFTFIQGMREPELHGITDIGIKIDKQKK